MENAMLEKWKSSAYEIHEPLVRLPTPHWVLTGEAIDVAWFFDHYWHPELDPKGQVVRPGLSSAERPGQFEQSLAQEILELQEAFQAAHSAYLMAAQRGNGAPMDRARFVLGELKSVLSFLVDDGEETVDDERLAAINTLYEDAASQDAVAAALDDYASFADLHRAAIHGLGGFSEDLIDEARRLAIQLREQSAKKVVGVPPGDYRAALELRNRIGTLLYDRMSKVRSVARFVLRHHPDIVRNVTSAYQRRRRVASKRARETEGELPTETETGVAPAPADAAP